MITYWINSHSRLLKAVNEHITIVFITMLIAVVIAGVITLFLRNKKVLSNIVITILSVFYSIPSLALFAILIPFTGLGRVTAVSVLVIYAQYILVRNFNIEIGRAHV